LAPGDLLDRHDVRPQVSRCSPGDTAEHREI
jgi:hypothetical protein